MNSVPVIPENASGANLNTQVLTHAHSFALRQAIFSQLNSSQKAEHDSLNTMREISAKHTKQILELLTHWLCADYAQAQADEIEEVQHISGLRHDELLRLASKKEELDLPLEVTPKELGKAKAIYDELGGLLGKNEWIAKGEKKNEILQAKTSYGKLKSKMAELEKDLKETNDAIRTYGDTFLENCCKNLETMSDKPPLGRALHSVIHETTNAISEEWRRHCTQQQEELESISANVARLRGMYSLGDQS